jgi:hypothetical protein
MSGVWGEELSDDDLARLAPGGQGYAIVAMNRLKAAVVAEEAAIKTLTARLLWVNVALVVLTVVLVIVAVVALWGYN